MPTVIIDELRTSLLKELSILKDVIKVDVSLTHKDIKILLASACSTGTALCELCSKPEYYFTEVMMLARSFIEKITNFCYLCVCEKSELDRFLLHPFYRTYHNSEREKYANKKRIKISYSGKEMLKTHPKITKALATFSETNPGKNWSSKTIDQKISLIEQKTNIEIAFFLMNTLTIYSDASEALHGSLYGCTFHLGLYEPNINSKNSNDINTNIIKNTALIIVQLVSMLHELLKYMHAQQNIEQQLNESNNITKRIVEILKEIFHK